MTPRCSWSWAAQPIPVNQPMRSARKPARTIRELTGKEHGSPRPRISHRAPRSAPGGNAFGSLAHKAASKVAKLFTSKKGR